jgi:hypothetical protein
LGKLKIVNEEKHVNKIMPLILREARKETDTHCHNYNEIEPLLFACLLFETLSYYIAQAGL